MKTMKKAVSLLLCLILLTGTAAAGGEGFADALGTLFDALSVRASAVESGTCGENLTWTLSDDGVLTISGTGEMEDYTIYSSPDPTWSPYIFRIKTIVIKPGVTSIGGLAFSDCEGLESITVPEGIKLIGRQAFFNCTSLTAIKIPDSVTEIEYGAFQGCEALISISIPKSVSIIESAVFDGCSGIEQITVSNENPFYHSSGNCLIETASKTLIRGCKNSNIPSDGSVTSIRNYAFSYCTGLKNIVIPKDVTSIGEGVFSACSGVESITVSKNNSVYHSNGNCLIETENKTLIAGCKNSVIPSDGSVTSIGDSAFYYCTGLTSISIPGSVKSIGIYTFCDCAELTSINIPNSVTSIGDGAFDSCVGLTSLKIPGSVINIGFAAFSNCRGLTSLEISDGVIKIEDSAFSGCTGLTSIEIPDSVTSIGCLAFFGCTGLTSIIIPDNIISISTDAFVGTAFYNDKSNWENGVLYIGKHLVKAEDGISGEYTIKDGTISVAVRAFWGCRQLVGIAVPNSVRSIDGDAFAGCDRLTSINIPNSVTSIGDYAFGNCTGLTSIEIPDSVKNIGDWAFSDCTGLTSIDIPDSVTEIGYYAFCGCKGLTSVTIPGNVTSIGGGAFYNCTELKDVYYYGTEEEWENIEIDSGNEDLTEADIHFIYYGLGKDSYNFSNFYHLHEWWKKWLSSEKPNCCFGMAVTGSGYYLNILDRADFGADADTPLSSVSRESAEPVICKYHTIQGVVGPKGSKGAEIDAIVAGGSLDKDERPDGENNKKYTRSDWNSCIDWIKAHPEYNNKGKLNVGIWYYPAGGHAVNFLYYKQVDGQDRLYVYDNEHPGKLMYFYMGADGYIREAEDSAAGSRIVVDSKIRGIDLMDVETYFSIANRFDEHEYRRYLFAEFDKAIKVLGENIRKSFVKGGEAADTGVIYEIPDEAEEIIIKPLADNAEFEYMGVTYSFGAVDEDTYGVLEILPETAEEGDKTEFVIENAPPRVQIGNFVAERTEDYRTTMTFKAEITDPNDDVAVHWFINGSDEGTGETFTVENAKADYTVQAKFINKAGEVVHESETETVKIKHGFFDMLIWFFKHLFNPGAYIKEQ